MAGKSIILGWTGSSGGLLLREGRPVKAPEIECGKRDQLGPPGGHWVLYQLWIWCQRLASDASFVVPIGCGSARAVVVATLLPKLPLLDQIISTVTLQQEHRRFVTAVVRCVRPVVLLPFVQCMLRALSFHGGHWVTRYFGGSMLLHQAEQCGRTATKWLRGLTRVLNVG